MARRERIAREFVEAQRSDLTELPHAPRLVRPGSYGTYPQHTRQGGPRAPTLDHGPLYTGEWREEVNGDFLDVLDQNEDPGFTLLADLRRPWPYVGFSVDVGEVPDGFVVVAGLVVLTRQGPAQLRGNVVANVLPEIDVTLPVAPFGMLALSGIYVGARVAVYVRQSGGDHPATVQMRGNLWGYNAPEYGP